MSFSFTTYMQHIIDPYHVYDIMKAYNVLCVFHEEGKYAAHLFVNVR